METLPAREIRVGPFSAYYGLFRPIPAPPGMARERGSSQPANAFATHFPNLTGQSRPKAGQFKPMQGKKFHHPCRPKTVNRSLLSQNEQRKKRVYSFDNWRRKDFLSMENEFMKRDYLLPDGCKDLMDVLKLKEQKHSSESWQTTAEFMQNYYAEIEDILAALPPNKEEIIIPKQMSLHQLGQLLTEKSYKSGNLEKEGCEVGMISYKPYAPLVFRDLKKMGLCKNANDMLDFETISKVLAKYGVTCKLAAE
jgi:hypothetical protein